MAQAFKCDVCKEYFDGYPWEVTLTVHDARPVPAFGDVINIKSCCPACKERKVTSFAFSEKEG